MCTERRKLLVYQEHEHNTKQIHKHAHNAE